MRQTALTDRPPLFAAPVRAGFPSPADDYVDRPLCLNAYLVPRPAATLFVRLRDDAMAADHFHPGDLLIVDRSLKPIDGRIVVVWINGELLLRRLIVQGRTGWLTAADPAYPPLALREGLDYQILGVVKHRIHSV
jgi:DNA polymerase V